MFQVQWNLFKPITCEGNKETSSGSAKNNATGGDSSSNVQANSESPVKMYHVWRDIEDNYQNHSQTDDCAVKPRFYTLAPVDTNSQDTPKLDGLVSKREILSIQICNIFLLLKLC